MRMLGQVALLAAFVTAGYGAFSALAFPWADRDDQRRRRHVLAATTVCLLTIVLGILAYALVVKDFSFEYVGRSTSTQLPWYYSLSSLWVGQAGSLLLWAWLLGAFSLVFSMSARQGSSQVRSTALGILQACLTFLLAIIVLAADPMQATTLPRTDGVGLSPLLQHPAMLLHPPVVFAGYAAWAIPFAVVLAALIHRSLDSFWLRQASSWSLLGWMILGGGILLGAHWAYQELGWGGYWAWDPVENGSLVPWLTGTALVHSLLAWRYRQMLPRTSVALAIATFALCNWATFLTRSGIFSSVHAFSQSPIGWMFLLEMLLVGLAGGAVLWLRRDQLPSHQLFRVLLTRECLILVSTALLILFSLVVIVGTLIAPVSGMWSGRTIQFGPEFYQRVLVPVGLTLLALTSLVPLLRWGHSPQRLQRRLLVVSSLAAVAGIGVAASCGVRSITGLGVAGIATLAASVLLAAWSCDARLYSTLRRNSVRNWPTKLGAQLTTTLLLQRRRYAAYTIHLGFVLLSVGVAGSSLGTRQEQFEIPEGQAISWNGWNVRHVELVQRTTADRLIAEAQLEVTGPGRATAHLAPARHWHRKQDEWTSEVAIHSTWRGDLYVILHAGLGEGSILVTLVDNPLITWLWWGGCLSLVGAVTALWPSQRRSTTAAQTHHPPAPSEPLRPGDHSKHTVSPQPLATPSRTRAA
ncbi:MAG: cytochrome c-type biogenesis CcmF C-terminal domain-containing protein [Pirellulales bacterium]